MDLDEFHYRLTRRARGLRPGLHRGAQHGDGQETVAHVSLLDGRDPRRLDLLASARDPMGRLLVRTARQRTSVPVYLIADLSASMGFRGRVSKLDLLADFTAALARSVYLSGDAFAFLGCDEKLREDFLLPPARSRGVGVDLARRLRQLVPTGRGADGLAAAAALVLRRDALVFLASDYHLPAPLLDRVLSALSRHEVVPVVLADDGETEQVPGFGIARVQDPETARERLVVLRPRVREELRARGRAHREDLSRCFRRHGANPLWITDHFDADRVTRHFHG